MHGLVARSSETSSHSGQSITFVPVHDAVGGFTLRFDHVPPEYGHWITVGIVLEGSGRRPISTKILI